MKKLKAKAEMIKKIQWNIDYHKTQLEQFELEIEVLGELSDEEILQLTEWDKFKN